MNILLSAVNHEIVVTLSIMKIEEAIVYVLAERNVGLKTEQIAEIINRRQLHVRRTVHITASAAYAWLIIVNMASCLHALGNRINKKSTYRYEIIRTKSVTNLRKALGAGKVSVRFE